MSTGTYISTTLHAGLVGWLLFNGEFESGSRELSVTEISIVSAEKYDIAVNNTPPIMEMAINQPISNALVEEVAPELNIKSETLEKPRAQPLIEPPKSSEALPVIPEQFVPQENSVLMSPLELVVPKDIPAESELLETSLKPKPRAAARITSRAVAPSEPDIDIGDVTRDAASRQNKPAEVKDEQTAVAPEASASEIVPEEVVQTAALAPAQSVRPLIRQTQKVVESKKKKSSDEPSVQDPLEAALSEALTGDIDTALSEVVNGSMVENVIQNIAINQNEIMQGLDRAIDEAIGKCNNVNMSTAAEQTTIAVAVSFDPNAKVIPGSIDLAEFISGDADSINVRLEAAKRTLTDGRCRDNLSEVIKGAKEIIPFGTPIEIEFGPIGQFGPIED
ncbi:MAG: hypothetical protein P8L40_05560 [Planktomarina sp.]|nr:hypothetical protein [Planktomarina sp.]